jgi:hypothetical protein
MDVGWPRSQRGQEHAPAVESVVDLGGKTDMTSGALQGHVKAGKEAQTSRQHGGNTAEIAAESLPCEQRAASSGPWKLGKEGADLVMSLGWE